MSIDRHAGRVVGTTGAAVVEVSSARHERSRSAAAESGGGPDSDLGTWATAAVATVDSHLRDLSLLQPVDGDSAGHTLAELADRPG